MTIESHNTMTRRVEPFEPLHAGKVGMYTCGPTVYNYAHIGNYRTYAFEDLLRRFLKWKGFDVVQVMNVTDVDDKSIRGSREAGATLDEYTAPYIDAFFEDLDAGGYQPTELEPAALWAAPTDLPTGIYYRYIELPSGR